MAHGHWAIKFICLCFWGNQRIWHRRESMLGGWYSQEKDWEHDRHSLIACCCWFNPNNFRVKQTENQQTNKQADPGQTNKMNNKSAKTRM